MIARPCPTHVSGCPCIQDDPFANLSSEAPDPADVIRMAYDFANPGMNSPDNFWDVPLSSGSCAGVDPQDTQDCAGGDAERLVDANQQTFVNKERTCSVPCACGASFSYTLKAGTITSTSQALADYLAQSICLFRAQQAKRCGPTAVTGAASAIDTKSATVQGTVNPNGASTSYFFEYGTSASYGSITPIVSIGTGTTSLPVFASLTGLISATDYHYRVVAVNSNGTSRGTDRTFKTLGTVVPLPIAWWPLDEIAIGNRVDVIAGWIIPWGTAGVPAKINRGILMLDGQIADSGFIINTPSIIGTGFSVTFWARWESMDVNGFFGLCDIQILDNGAFGSLGEATFRWNGATNRIVVRMQDQLGIFYTQTFPFVPVVGTFYFFHCSYDSATGQLSFSVDGAADNTTIGSYIIPMTTAIQSRVVFSGADLGVGSTTQITFDEYAFHPNKLTTDQLAAIYNGGAGTTWPIV